MSNHQLNNQTVANNQGWITGAKIGIFVTILYFILIELDLPVGDFNGFFLFLSCWTFVFWLKYKKEWKFSLSQELKKAWWIEWTVGIFPLVFVFFLARGFIVEPFKIPSGSMEPLFQSGDVLLVNKFYYDFKIPVLNKTLIKNNEVEKGNVIIFKFPPNPQIYYVKRVVATPGDEIQYTFATKELKINGVVVQKNYLKDSTEYDTGDKVSLYNEKLGKINHIIQIKNEQSQLIIPTFKNYPNDSSCVHNDEKMICIIPKGFYFAMGDNRDNSLDSRFWGFVPENNIIGRPQAILFNFHALSRIKWLSGNY